MQKQIVFLSLKIRSEFYSFILQIFEIHYVETINEVFCDGKAGITIKFASTGFLIINSKNSFCVTTITGDTGKYPQVLKLYLNVAF